MKPICFLDIETTGLDVAKDRVVQIGIVRIEGILRSEKNQLINPEVPIPSAATAIHGITNEQVKYMPTFSVFAPKVLDVIGGCDLAGFGILNFDLGVLWEEFHRAGIEWDLAGVSIIDAGNIFKKKEPRTLAAAVKFFCGRDHSESHDALADASATADVLRCQLDRYEDLRAMSRAELADFSRLEEFRRIDLAGKFVRDADGDAVYNFGKNKGQKVKEDMGLCRWMLNKDFSANTLLHARKILDEIEAAWERPADAIPGDKEIPF